MVKPWFQNPQPRSMAKDAAGTSRQRKKQCLWKLDGISENSRDCMEATRTKRSNYRFHSRYTFSEGVSPPGIKSQNLFLMITTSFLDSVFLFSNPRHIRHRFQVKSNLRFIHCHTKLIVTFMRHVCMFKYWLYIKIIINKWNLTVVKYKFLYVC